MKTKIFLTTILLGTALTLSAQDMYDAQKFSSTHVYGSARTLGMGNAVTAVGGDLGSVFFNPAGGAVAGYSQITLSPGIAVSSNNTTGAILTTGATTPEGFGDANTTSHTRLTPPSFGASLNIDTRRERGLVSYSFGVMGTQTNNFLGEVYASGINDRTSYLGYLAASSKGYPASGLDEGSAAYDKYPWLAVNAYQAGLIATYGGKTDEYVGATETIQGNDIGLAGDIDQRYGQLTFGNKYDIVFNWAGNFSNIVYVGANLGITSLTYQYDDYIREQALHSADFPILFDDGVTRYFNSANARFSYDVTGAGIFGQLGIIARLPIGLRLGAMIQTPTLMTIKEHWSQDMSISFQDVNTISAESPTGSNSYRLRTPWKMSFGLAYTIGEKALISADYELMNYRNMKYRSPYRGSDDFGDANWDISQFMGVSHNLRVGAEVKPVRKLALRVGYNLVTSPEKDDNSRYYFKPDHLISLGAGYAADGSFFVDLALRARLRSTSQIQAYADPIYRVNGLRPHQSADSRLGNYVSGINSPGIAVFNNILWDSIVTVGWRF